MAGGNQPPKTFFGQKQLGPGAEDKIILLYHDWLVVWNILEHFFIFHNAWDNPSHWLRFFKMVKTMDQMMSSLATCKPELVTICDLRRCIATS